MSSRGLARFCLSSLSSLSSRFPLLSVLSFGFLGFGHWNLGFFDLNIGFWGSSILGLLGFRSWVLGFGALDL